MSWWSAIILGFLGGFHCLGMCGPIAMALPVNNKNFFLKTISISAYNLGRIITYSVFGLLFGAIGKTFVLFGFQQALSVVLGFTLLVMLIFSQTGRFNNVIFSKISFFVNFIKAKLIMLFRRNSLQSLFLIGILNGLLPCGLVYIAITGAISTGTVLNGALFMALFGVGTLPFMFSVSFYSHLISVTVRNRIRKVVPLFIGFMAVLLILRGLNLGISYISPKLSNECSEKGTGSETIKCCHK